MQFTDVQIDPQPDGEFTTVTFRGDQGDAVVVRLRAAGQAPGNDDAMLERASAAMLDAVAASKNRPLRPLSDMEVDASGRAVEPPAATESLEEEDDNAYQRPDEALPSDEEASAIVENPMRERGRFGQE